MKGKTKTAIFSITSFIFYACGPSASEQAARDKALIDAVVKATVKNMAENNSKESKPSTKQSTVIEATYIKNASSGKDIMKYDWAGEYSFSDDYVGYSLVINNESPARWAEYGWEMEGVGIQLFFKIRGYAMRNDNGDLDFYYLEKVDGGFFQEDQMDINEVMFKLKKNGKLFRPINGVWKANDFIKTFAKS